jgi:HD-like signal output (HDOD) protein
MFAPTLKEIFAVAAKLPAAPQILSELFDLMEDVNVDTEEIATLLQRDGALSASVLRISNSAYYGPGGIGSVHEAVQRVGFGEVHRMVGCAVVGNLSDRALVFYDIEAEELREHMICTALAAEALASVSGYSMRHAYTAGLLRPIGMMVLDRLARDQVGPADIFELDRDGNYGEWESKTTQLRNAPVTAVTLNEWNFATDVVEAVRGHTLATTVKPPTRGAYLLNIAGWVTRELGQGLPGERDLWELTPDKLEQAGLQEEQVKAQLDEVAFLFERMQPALR